MKDTEICRFGIVSCSNLAPSTPKEKLTSIKRSPDCTVRTNLEIFCAALRCQQLLSYTLFQTQSFYSLDREPASASNETQWLLQFKTAHSVLELSFLFSWQKQGSGILKYPREYNDSAHNTESGEQVSALLGPVLCCSGFAVCYRCIKHSSLEEQDQWHYIWCTCALVCVCACVCVIITSAWIQ